MSNNYTHYLLKLCFESIYDNKEIMDEYLSKTGKEYETLDATMMDIVRKHKNYCLYHVKKSLSVYVIVTYNIGYDSIEFDSSKYKIDIIKKILSSESNPDDSIALIESLVFQDKINPILTDEEYLTL